MTELDAAPVAGRDSRPAAPVTGSTASGGGGDPVGERGHRAAAWVFAAFVAMAFPLVVFKMGSYLWFFRDDFSFITGREASSLNDLFRPHNVHWSTVPILTFRGLWSVFGIRSYRPYLAAIVLVHLTAAVLLRLVMRRAGVGAWIATAAAAVLVLFGPGAENILWGFQVGFVGSLVFGLTQLILADHEGPIDWRDALGIGAGVLAIMSSGVGVTMAVVVGMAMLLRRGWKVAVVHTVPLAALYGIWSLVEHPLRGTPQQRPPIGFMLRWLRNGDTATFVGLAHFRFLAGVLAIVLVVGLVLVCGPARGAALRGRAALPVALLAGGPLFGLITAEGRFFQGDTGARASRYVYLGAAFTLPALALAADAIARRWRVLLAPMVFVFLIPLPFNSTKVNTGVFGAGYFASEQRVLTTVVRMPFATQVPRDVRPIPDVYLSETLTIGFLLDAARSGKLRPSSGPVAPRDVNELKVRLGVSQRLLPPMSKRCRTASTLDLDPRKGAIFGISENVMISTRKGRRQTSPPITFSPTNGSQLRIELAGLHLRLRPGKGATSVTLCTRP